MTSPVVFLPGSLCDERVFDGQLRHIDQPWEVADLTLDDSITAMAGRVLQEAPDRFAVVGLSLGGIVAAEIAHLAPERVAGMALIDTNLDAPDDKQLRDRRRWGADVRAGHFTRVVESLVPALTTSPRTTGQLIVSMAMTVGAAGFLRQNNALLDRHDRRSIVERLECPLLIACGRADTLCPPSLHTDLAARSPHARLLVVEHAGHLSTIDQPDALTGAISDWLEMCNNHQPRRDPTHECTTA